MRGDLDPRALGVRPRPQKWTFPPNIAPSKALETGGHVQ